MSLRSVSVALRAGAAGALFLACRLQRHGIRWLLMALLAAAVSVGPQGAWSMAGLGTPAVAHASASTSSATVTCSRFFATGTTTTSNHYVGVRVWVGSVGGTALIDSFTNVGAPTNYAPVNSATGAFSVIAGFAVQPAGTTLIARVYGAPTNAFSSYDQGSFSDTTVVCQPGGASASSAAVTCSGFLATGTANASDGFVGVRVWRGSVGGPALIDSFINVGAPTYYAPVNSATGAFSVNAGFAAQPAGTVLIARVYGAPTNAFGSYDTGAISDITVACQPGGATITSSTLTCSSFSAVGTGNPASGFAAMRVWTVGIDNPGGTPLIDSYTNHGVPTVYAPISSGGATTARPASRSSHRVPRSTRASIAHPRIASTAGTTPPSRMSPWSARSRRSRQASRAGNRARSSPSLAPTSGLVRW